MAKTHLFSIKKPLLWVVSMAILVVFYLGYILFVPNIRIENEDDTYLYIRDHETMDDLVLALTESGKIRNVSSFKQVASLLGYKKVKPGRYDLSIAMNNFKLVRMLRSGRQKPVKLTFNNIRTKEQLAGRLSKELMADSVSIVQLMNDSAYLAPFGFTVHTAIANFIPDTYEVFWDLDAQEIFDRMNKEYLKFWTPERKAKADSIPMTPVQVATLAAIVEEETNNKAERPQVAGLYINRLNANMPLQADPTLKFAVGDFSIRRLRMEHILYISPYNTYRNKGLPPGPIRVASANGIDAVLNYAKHNYIYMCAKETFDGQHNFAVSYTEHMANARRYQQALNARNIE
jgi:UPF0755 protein